MTVERALLVLIFLTLLFVAVACVVINQELQSIQVDLINLYDKP